MASAKLNAVRLWLVPHTICDPIIDEPLDALPVDLQRVGDAEVALPLSFCE